MNRSLKAVRTFTMLALLLVGLSACTDPAEAPQPAAPTAEEAEAPTEDAVADASLAGDPAHGEELFVACAACHGPNGEGVEGLGKSLHDNAFIADMSDEEVVAFLKTGRPASHELNTTGVDMPPKGGNPALSEEDLYDIVAFIRTLE